MNLSVTKILGFLIFAELITAQAHAQTFPANAYFKFRYQVEFPQGVNSVQAWRGNNKIERCDIANMSAHGVSSIASATIFKFDEDGIQIAPAEKIASFILVSDSIRLKITCTKLIANWGSRMIKIANTFGEFINHPEIHETEGSATLRGAPRGPEISGCADEVESYCRQKTSYSNTCKEIAVNLCTAHQNFGWCLKHGFDAQLKLLNNTQTSRPRSDLAFDNTIEWCNTFL